MGNLVTTQQAIKQALIDYALHDERAFFLAQNIHDHDALYGTLTNLKDYIAIGRVIETPIAENATIGMAVGAAMMGKRPIITMHRVEFALLAIDQIVNNAAKASYISQGALHVPLLLRLIIGRGWGQGPKHSQSFDALFASVPGLKVIAPCMPHDSYNMIQAALRDDNPVICLENRWVHYVSEYHDNQGQDYALQGSVVKQEGHDITIVANSYMVLEAMRAAILLATIGISCEVIDLRVLRPINMDPIGKSVVKTGHLLCVDSSPITCSISSTITAHIAQHYFDALQAAPVTMGMADHPLPVSVGLIEHAYPHGGAIIHHVGRILRSDASAIADIYDIWHQHHNDSPIDIPNKHFKGPF